MRSCGSHCEYECRQQKSLATQLDIVMDRAARGYIEEDLDVIHEE